MERSSTGQEYDDVPRDIGKRMHSVGQPEVHSNSKTINSNLEPKQINRTKQIPPSCVVLSTCPYLLGRHIDKLVISR